MINSAYDKLTRDHQLLKRRYESLCEGVEALERVIAKLQDENKFIRNEKIMWSQEKILMHKSQLKFVSDFNSKKAELSDEIVRLRDMIKTLGGDPDCQSR